MRRFFATAPAWRVVAVEAVVFLAWMTLFYGLSDHTPWLRAFVVACLGTAIVSPFMWIGHRRQRRETEWATGPLTGEQQWVVARAANTGVAPEDPTLRAAALAMARYRLTAAVRQRAGLIAVFVAVIAGSVLFAVTDGSIVFAVCAVIAAATLIQTMGYPRRQRRRIAQLEQLDGTATVGTVLA